MRDREEQGPVAWAIEPGIARADIPALCERLAGLLRDSGAPSVNCDLGSITKPDVVTVEALARLQLTARRLGRGIRFHRPPEALLGLVGLTGLGTVLGLDLQGQAEQREKPLGVEEIVDPDDLPG